MTVKRRGKKKKRDIDQYDHKGQTRLNNPPVGLVTPETDSLAPTRRTFEYDPHLDPQLVWAGKKEHPSFEVPTVSLHVHERIDPRTIVEAVRRRNGNHRPVQPCSSGQRRGCRCAMQLTSTGTRMAGRTG